MSLEKKIISACLSSRRAFTAVNESEDKDVALPAAEFILKSAAEYYSIDDNASKVDVDWLKAKIDLTFDNPKKANEYKDIVDELVGLDVSASNIATLVIEKRRKTLAQKLAIALVNDEKDVDSLIESYSTLGAFTEGEEDDVLHNVSVEDTVEHVLDSNALIKLPTKSLNEALDGGVLPGTHIIVFARPEVGKTAFCTSVMRSMAHQKLHGIYFGNEDPIRQIVLRAQCCFTGMDKHAIKADPEEAQRRLDVSGFEHVRFIPLNPGTPAQIRKYCRMYKPKWVLVDQMRNLVVRADTRVNQLEFAATEMRNISKEFNCVGISLTQAGDSAENKLVLTMGDVDFSNTGIPAQADVLAGIGCNPEFEAAGTRMLSLPKNKVSGKHVHFPLRLNQFTSRYEDI